MPAADRQPGILFLLGDPRPVHTLLAGLRDLGMQVDTAIDGQDARKTFFAAGGHDCLVIGPDVRPGIARDVLQSLRGIDPELPIATFGPEAAPTPRPGHVSLAGFHPSSRAGTGALVRFLRTLRLR